MDITVRKYMPDDAGEAIKIWNEIITEGAAFPQLELLNEENGNDFFLSQSYTAIAEADGKIAGLYTLHPNNVGRCGHLGNASFAVYSHLRGLHIGEKLVKDCLEKAKELGFRIMQFNAVVESNIHARHLYERMGFKLIGMIPEGFLMKDGHYENIYLYYQTL